MVVTSTGLVNPKTGKFPNGTVTVVSSTNKVSATLTVGRSAYAAAWSPRTQDFYIACEGSNLTFVLNGSTFVLIGKPLATPQYAGDAVYDPGRGEIAVIGFSNLTGTPAKTIVTLISAANTVAGSLTLPTGPVGGGAYDPNNQDAYLSNGGAGSVSVIH
jgi:DNA-binding beta-propeller fold protein YncE